jgi:hypothetical protein
MNAFRNHSFFSSFCSPLRPTLEEASTPSDLSILGGMLGASLVARPFDPAINDFRDAGGNLLLGRKEADDIRLYTHGPIQIGIALTQLMIDTENGLAHSRALILGSLSHNLLAEIVNRERQMVPISDLILLVTIRPPLLPQPL